MPGDRAAVHEGRLPPGERADGAGALRRRRGDDSRRLGARPGQPGAQEVGQNRQGQARQGAARQARQDGGAGDRRADQKRGAGPVGEAAAAREGVERDEGAAQRHPPRDPADDDHAKRDRRARRRHRGLPRGRQDVPALGQARRRRAPGRAAGQGRDARVAVDRARAVPRPPHQGADVGVPAARADGAGAGGGGVERVRFFVMVI
mmetsp:Transcript_35728/g.110618  ORF Transcript_35728/g.110618 Transcript_35728/m.110618 type:complete len:205 (-) Transcript_35728:15-629(-)